MYVEDTYYPCSVVGLEDWLCCRWKVITDLVHSYYIESTNQQSWKSAPLFLSTHHMHGYAVTNYIRSIKTFQNAPTYVSYGRVAMHIATKYSIKF